MDEKNIPQESIKHGYSLNLKNGILADLHGLNVDQLSSDQLKKINNFDLWIIEINHRYNKDFEPIDLFLRLNTKAISDQRETHSRCGNSYIHKDIILTIKNIFEGKVAKWFYFRKKQ